MGIENCYNNDHCDNMVNSEMYFKNEKLIKRNAKSTVYHAWETLMKATWREKKNKIVANKIINLIQESNQEKIHTIKGYRHYHKMHKQNQIVRPHHWIHLLLNLQSYHLPHHRL